MAYQGYGHSLGREPIERLYAVAVGDFAPDLTLILDIPPEVGVNRAHARHDGEDRYERMDLNFHRRLRAGFLEIAAREPRRCVIIDASGSVDEVHGAILKAVAERLPNCLPS
jgi:dTMP kinase